MQTLFKSLSLCVLTLYAVSYKSYSQSEDLLNRIKLIEELQQLSADKNYDRIIERCKDIPSRDSLYLYGFESYVAHAYIMKGDTAAGLRYTIKAIENQDIGEVGQLKYRYSKYNLDSNEVYQSIIENFDHYHNKYSGQLNNSIRDRVLEIYYTDQRVRNCEMTVWGDSIATNNVRFASNISDSINVVAFKNLLKNIGRYPGISDIGKTLTHNFQFVLAHFTNRLDQDTLAQYFKRATLAGQIPSHIGPHVLDKARYYRGEKELLYAAFGNSNDYVDGVYHYRAVKDIEYLDARRAEFLLPPLYIEASKRKSVLPAGYKAEYQKPLSTLD